MPLLVVLNLLFITAPLGAVWWIGHNHIEILIDKRGSSQCVAIVDLRMTAEAAFNGCQSIESIVVFAAPGMDISVSSLSMQTVSHTKQKIGATTGRVINMDVLTLRLRYLRGHDVGNQRDNIVGRILLSGSRSTDVCPLALDMLLQRSDGRVIVW